jgi:predicted dehydrogenase
MSAPLRLATIGVGHLGRHHARLLATLPDVSFVAAVDLVAERAQAAVAGSTAEALADYRALFGRVDAVTVAVPTVDHLRVATEFLERGVHVLVEKPMAASLAEADAMLAAARTSGATLAIGHTERFNPAIAAALPQLRTPRFIEVHRLSGFPERAGPDGQGRHRERPRHVRLGLHRQHHREPDKPRQDPQDSLLPARHVCLD